ncbi:MAG: dihydrolipoyl dehydrogenase [Candidatus Tectomicrobia bacterium]|uniref:Dihydrolipoyl dehydrogenase n=1 Tax=Tectimicrobiota bacterium TaxID=2528274 RepID=A0A933LQN1_UNCTE|nr:dihydrolipoyl dehydrogenase [Candidatus Tectomicrobia bacterium]
MAIKSETYNLAVLGSGPGGYVGAIRAAQLGLKVALVEKENLGGVCLNWGCIPTKALLKNAEVISLLQRADEFGISISNYSASFAKAVERSRKVSQQLSKGVEFLMKKNKVDVFYGHGRLTSREKLEILDQNGLVTNEISAQKILLATGSRTKVFPGMEIDGKRIIGSSEAMVLEEAPKSMAIIGAGAIGVEFAYLFSAYGTEITLIEMLPRILPLEDREISETLQRSFKKRGIKVHTDARVDALNPIDQGVEVVLSENGGKQTVTVEKVLLAVGRTPNSENIGLESMGIRTEKGFITVDKNYRTNIENIYAAGDLIGAPLLAHVASAEAVAALEIMAGVETSYLNYEAIPSCTYCQPQVASVGLTEEKAKEKGYEVKVGKFFYRANGKALAIGEPEGLVKIVTESKYGEILGVHIIGAEATELIAESSLGKAIEATYQDLGKTIHSHPTLSEMIMEAAKGVDGLAIHS